MSKIQWKPVPGFSAYEISCVGNVRRTIPKGRYKSGYVLRPKIGSDGYLIYGLVSDENVDKLVRINRAVCMAFNGPPPTPEHHAAHIDGNKLNNHFLNLRWATKKENEADKLRHGTKAVGSKHGSSKLTEADIPAIRSMATAGLTTKDIGSIFGVHERTIRFIIDGQAWTHV